MSLKTERIGQKRITKNGLWEMECIEYNKANDITIRIQVEIDGVIYNIDRKTYWSSFNKGEVKFILKINNKEYKKCSNCKEILPIEEFNKKRGECKKCQSSKYKVYHEEHKDKLNTNAKEWRKNNKDRIKNYNKKYHKEYYENNRNIVKEKNKKWRENNKEKLKEYHKKYREENPHIKFNGHNRRRQKQDNQGRGIDKIQWYEMMKFFDFKCAYSGEYIGGTINEKRTTDHIVALDNGGLNEPWNLAPMYLNYNSSKNTIKNVLDWYMEQEYFDIDRLNKIVEWQVYAYEKWGGEEFGELILITDLLEDYL